MLAIVGGNLIDGTGSPKVDDVTVLIDGERIIEVGPRASIPIPEGAEILDATGHTIMPGLIDVHDHLASGGYGLTGRWGMDEPSSLFAIRTSQVIEDTLAAGYTTVRDAGGLDAGFKMAVEEGLIKGPRLIVSINIMSPTGGIEDKVSGSGHRKAILGHDPLAPDGVADGVDGVRAKVRELIRCGADQIKFATTGGASGRPGNGPLDQAYALDEAKALVDEAAALGRSTLCHAVGGTGLPIAIKAGAGSIEHGCYLATDPDMLKMMADQGTFFTPTFEVYDFHSTVSAPHIRVRAQALMNIHIRSVELAIKEGVRIVAGTDAGGFVHGDNARELELMVEKGMSTSLAIQAATGYAAECCGLGKDVGTITAGKLADIIVVDGDPLSNISILRDRERLLLIMKGGDAYKNRLPVRELQLA
jgi:imidazolonepropionase-like amidohydrolase